MNQFNRLKMCTEYKLLELRFTNVRCFREGNCIDLRKNVNNDIIEMNDEPII